MDVHLDLSHVVAIPTIRAWVSSETAVVAISSEQSMMGRMVPNESHVDVEPPDGTIRTVQSIESDPLVMVIAFIGPILVVAGVTWLLVALAGRKRS